MKLKRKSSTSVVNTSNPNPNAKWRNEQDATIELWKKYNNTPEAIKSKETQMNLDNNSNTIEVKSNSNNIQDARAEYEKRIMADNTYDDKTKAILTGKSIAQSTQVVKPSKPSKPIQATGKNLIRSKSNNNKNKTTPFTTNMVSTAKGKSYREQFKDTYGRYPKAGDAGDNAKLNRLVGTYKSPTKSTKVNSDDKGLTTMQKIGLGSIGAGLVGSGAAAFYFANKAGKENNIEFSNSKYLPSADKKQLPAANFNGKSRVIKMQGETSKSNKVYNMGTGNTQKQLTSGKDNEVKITGKASKGNYKSAVKTTNTKVVKSTPKSTPKSTYGKGIKTNRSNANMNSVMEDILTRTPKGSTNRFNQSLKNLRSSLGNLSIIGTGVGMAADIKEGNDRTKQFKKDFEQTHGRKPTTNDIQKENQLRKMGYSLLDMNL